MKKIISLTESQLYSLIEQAINELDARTYRNAGSRRMDQAYKRLSDLVKNDKGDGDTYEKSERAEKDPIFQDLRNRGVEMCGYASDQVRKEHNIPQEKGLPLHLQYHLCPSYNYYDKNQNKWIDNRLHSADKGVEKNFWKQERERKNKMPRKYDFQTPTNNGISESQFHKLIEQVVNELDARTYRSAGLKRLNQSARRQNELANDSERSNSEKDSIVQDLRKRGSELSGYGIRNIRKKYGIPDNKSVPELIYQSDLSLDNMYYDKDQHKWLNRRSAKANDENIKSFQQQRDRKNALPRKYKSQSPTSNGLTESQLRQIIEKTLNELGWTDV